MTMDKKLESWPFPWLVHYNNQDNDGSWMLLDSEDSILFRAQGSQGGMLNKNGTDRAVAEFVQLACNCHDDFVEALEKCQEHFYNYMLGNFCDDDPEVLLHNEISHLLAKAKGE